MKQSTPATLLDRFYIVGIFVKGIDGLLELIGGIVLLSLSAGTIVRITNSLTQNELRQDPHDFIANHLLRAGQHLAHGQHAFVAAFLLIHGAVKVGLVICLLLKKFWAYPLGIAVLGLLFLYQIYQLVISPGFGMAFLSVLDAAIIWLIWREWHEVRTLQATAS